MALKGPSLILVKSLNEKVEMSQVLEFAAASDGVRQSFVRK